MGHNRLFLSELLDQEIYLISDHKPLKKVSDDQTNNQLGESDIPYEETETSGVIVIVDENSGDEEIDFLKKILASIQLSESEVLIIKSGKDFEALVSTLSEKPSGKIISFGITYGKSRLLDIQTRYSPASIEGKTVILADKLSAIMNDTGLKRSLWNCLKEVF